MTERAARSLTTQLVITGLASVSILTVNLATGILVARTLGAAGRGEVAVLLTLTQIIGWLAALGMNEGVTYLAAKRPQDGPRIVGTSCALIFALGAAGIIIAQLLLPLVLRAQDDELLEVGRLFTLSIALGVASSLLLAALAGNQAFDRMNLVLLVQPATYLFLLVVLAISGRLSVATVLGSAALATGVAAALALALVARSVGIGRPSWSIAREAARYGLRVQGSLLGGLGTARLDFLVLPALLPPTAIGLYSVATNTSSIVLALGGALGTVVFPVAARRGGKAGGVVVARMLRLVTAAGLIVAVPLGVLAPVLLELVYGSEFSGAATALRILLPGVVLAMAAGILEGGLQAANRPLAASCGQLVGLAVTLIGLAVTLRPYGILGAAGTTTAAYGSAFLVVVVFMLKDENFDWREAVSARGLRQDVMAFWRRLRKQS